jgi:hypothetical protein
MQENVINLANEFGETDERIRASIKKYNTKLEAANLAAVEAAMNPSKKDEL